MFNLHFLCIVKDIFYLLDFCKEVQREELAPNKENGEKKKSPKQAKKFGFFSCCHMVHL